jgi:hypothetical protein
MCSISAGLLSQELTYTVSATLMDPNYQAPTAMLVQKVSKAATNTTISGLPVSVIASQAFSFTATVQAVSPGTGSPTGSMQFAFCRVNEPECTGNPGGAAALPPGENQITFSLPSGVLKPGTYSLVAHYLGDLNYQSSESPTTDLMVAKVPTTLALEASRNPAKDGGREVLRAVITADPLATSSEAGPTGDVTFTITGASGDTLVCDTGGTVIPVGTKSANQGVARCDISGMVMAADSPYTVKAHYSGDSVYVKSKVSGTFGVIPRT